MLFYSSSIISSPYFHILMRTEQLAENSKNMLCLGNWFQKKNKGNSYEAVFHCFHKSGLQGIVEVSGRDRSLCFIHA